MGISGLIAGEASRGIEELIAQQLLQAQQAERERQAKAAEAARTRQLDLVEAGQRAAQERFDQETEQNAIHDMRAQQDKTRERMTALQGEQDQMDAAAALQRELAAIMGDTSVPDPVKRYMRLQRAGMKGGSVEDVLSPQERQANDDAAVRRAARIAGAQRSQAPTERPQWVTRDGKPIYAPPQPGDVPFDKQAGVVNQDATSTAAEVQRLARQLLTMPGMPNAFGVVDAALPTIRQETADAEGVRNSLRSLLTLENMGKMKGVLSDADMRILAQASTTLQDRMSDEAARAELLRLDQVMSKVTGQGGSVPPPVSSHGSGGPQVGERRTINGQLAEWDGQGWKAVR